MSQITIWLALGTLAMLIGVGCLIAVRSRAAGRLEGAAKAEVEKKAAWQELAKKAESGKAIQAEVAKRPIEGVLAELRDRAEP